MTSPKGRGTQRRNVRLSHGSGRRRGNSRTQRVLPGALQRQLRAGQVNLDDPAVTLTLLKLNAVVGLTYDSLFGLHLSAQEKSDLVEYLKSL